MTSTSHLSIRGMSCASCVAHIEKKLMGVPGVTQASVNLATEKAVVVTEDGVDAEALIDAVLKAGYEAALDSGEESKDPDDPASWHGDEEHATLRRDFQLAAILTLPVFVLEMGAHMIPSFHHLLSNRVGDQMNWWIQLVLTGAVLLLPGRRFFQKGVPSLLRLAPDMNSLVVLGTSAAYGFSVVATVAPGFLPEGTVNVYFEAAAVIVTLILL
ncbi:MAG: cation transporter, partial [Planctomycetota bacterium]